jgi:hypothetical protein
MRKRERGRFESARPLGYFDAIAGVKEWERC